jgi:peptidoglycan/xylan/chitin deacetylase (PgdA/CDA1 family)
VGRRGAHFRPRPRGRFVALRVLLTVSVLLVFVERPAVAAEQPKAAPVHRPHFAPASVAQAVVLVAPPTPTTTTRPPTTTTTTRAPANALPVSLTFDDGPNAVYTPQVLDILARYGVRATFFVVGQEVVQHPELVQRIVAEGHTLGNHTWDHRNLTQLTAEEVASEFDRTQEALIAAGVPSVRCARAPFGRVNQVVRDAVSARGLSLSRWTADSNDWKTLGTQAIVREALKGAQSGAVILLHDSGPDMSQTVAALPAIIDGIRSRGLRLAPIC